MIVVIGQYLQLVRLNHRLTDFQPAAVEPELKRVMRNKSTQQVATTSITSTTDVEVIANRSKATDDPQVYLLF